jgi:uncharacterized protein involved in exopolysaccharide biosynthesis
VLCVAAKHVVEVSSSAIWLVVFSAVLGLLLGMVLATLFHWRTRTPRG